MLYGRSQARLLDHSRKFNEAASRYHELSFVTDIDEGERIFMLWVPDEDQDQSRCEYAS